MKRKQIFDKEGNEFYYRYVKRLSSYRIIELYKKRENRKFYQSKFIFLYECDISNSVGKMSDLSLWAHKSNLNEAISMYKKSIENSNDLSTWDGILADDPAIKKQIMRDKRIGKLLEGDYSKLEKFLEEDE